MKAWSIRIKLIVLSVGLLALTLIVGAIEFYGGSRVTHYLENISNVQLPAVRNMTLADMMHDGLRAVVYKALYVGTLDDIEAKKEIAEELKEFYNNLNEYLGAIEKLDIQPKTRAAINDTKAEIEAYLKSSEKITALALSGNRVLAAENLADFNQAFTSLEDKMGILGETIENDAETSRRNRNRQSCS